MIDIAVVLNGKIADQDGFLHLIKSADYIIAVDGGLNHLIEVDIRPDLFLGDFDSAHKHSLAKAAEWQLRVMEFPTDKNFTDSELALAEIFAGVDLTKYSDRKKNNKPVIGLLAAFGSRYDHVLSNQFLAQRYVSKADFILSDGLSLQWIVDGPRNMRINWPMVEQEQKHDFNFTLLALSDVVESVTLQNSKYELRSYDLNFGHSIGVSNQVKSDFLDLASDIGTKDVKVCFNKGILTILIVPKI